MDPEFQDLLCLEPAYADDPNPTEESGSNRCDAGDIAPKDPQPPQVLGRGAPRATRQAAKAASAPSVGSRSWKREGQRE